MSAQKSSHSLGGRIVNMFFLISMLSAPLAPQVGRIFRIKTPGQNTSISLQFVSSRSLASLEKPPGRRGL